MILSWSFIMFYWRFFLLKYYLLQISANQTSEPHCGRISDFQPMIGQAIGPHYYKAAGNQSTLETGEWPTEDVPSDDSTEPYKVGPIDMVQRLCIVMLPCVPSKFHQKLALHERVQLYKRWTIINQPKLTKAHQVSEFLLFIL